MQSETRFRTYRAMGTYIPHREGTVQNIVRLSLARYQAYANAPQVIVDRPEQFSGCAGSTRGVARIRCPDCGHSYFRPFSCKVFHLCPSCDQKRTFLYAEYLIEDLLLDLLTIGGRNMLKFGAGPEFRRIPAKIPN